MKPFKLTIAEPCHEKWNEMNPQEKGRFCGVCDKTVVDFTNKNPVEISNVLQNSTGKVCGRFNTTDLNKVHVSQQTSATISQSKTRWFAWLTVFAFLGFGKKASACPPPLVQDKLPFNPNQIEVKKGHTIIKGEIKRSDKKTGIAEVEIKIYSGGKVIAVTKSFVNGSYFITVPENTIFDFKIDVEYNAVNYVTQILNNLPVQKEEITMNVEMLPLEQIEIVEYTMGKVSYDNEIVEVTRPIETYVTMGAVAYTEVVRVNSIFDNSPTKNLEDSTIVEIANPAEFQLNIYPNPTANLVTIDVLNSTQASIQLFDFNGKLIQSFTSREAKNMLDLSNHPNGTYIVRVIDDATNKVVQKKIIKVY